MDYSQDPAVVSGWMTEDDARRVDRTVHIYIRSAAQAWAIRMMRQMKREESD